MPHFNLILFISTIHGHAIFSFVYIGSTTGDGLQPIAYLMFFQILQCVIHAVAQKHQKNNGSNHITIDDSTIPAMHRPNYNLDRKNKIHYNSNKEHLKVSKIAKLKKINLYIAGIIY